MNNHIHIFIFEGLSDDQLYKMGKLAFNECIGKISFDDKNNSLSITKEKYKEVIRACSRASYHFKKFIKDIERQSWS